MINKFNHFLEINFILKNSVKLMLLYYQTLLDNLSTILFNNTNNFWNYSAKNQSESSNKLLFNKDKIQSIINFRMLSLLLKWIKEMVKFIIKMILTLLKTN